MMTRLHSLSLPLLLTSLALAPACTEDEPLDPMAVDDAATDGDADDDGTTGGQDGQDDETSAGPADSTGGDPPDSGEETGQGSGEETGDSGIDVGALYDCEDPAIVFVPMMGPGFDPATGAFVGSPQDTYVAHTTQAVVSPEMQDEFLAVNDTVVAQLMQTEGVLGVGFAIEPECGFLRTIGLWEDEQSMYAFVGSGAHLEAMTMASQISLSGKTTHWTIDAGAMPLTWDMAFEALEEVEPSAIYD